MRELIKNILREHTNEIGESRKKLTTDEFINKAKKVHGNEFDYSKTNYVNSTTKIEIICPIHGSFFVLPDSHIRSKTKCPKCSGKAKSNTNDFIQRAINVHGNDYDYSKVDYKNNKTKVKIICPIHGEFLQSPVNHINQKQGCPKCGGTGKKTKEDFIKQSKEIHGDKFDYSKVEYVNNVTPVEIICPIHGEFKQKPVVHIDASKHGCPKCGWQVQNDKVRGNVDDFIVKAKEIHNDKYNYSDVDYQANYIKVKIICPIHGEFLQSPVNHINQKQGCPKCGEIRTGLKTRRGKDKFVELSNIVHNNKYDYSKVNYKTAHDYVTIICPKHGEFLQKPYSHLNKRGCPSCNESQGEKLITTLLRKHNLPHVRQKRFSDCVNIHGVKRCLQLPFDFYLPNSNSCIEYDGEQHFFPVLSFGGEKAFAETKLRDELKNKYCQEKGINLIRIPYTMKKEDIEPFILKELGI